MVDGYAALGLSLRAYPVSFLRGAVDRWHDTAGEAADLVCLKEESDHIRLALLHCKFADGDAPGGRVKDAVEAASQAVRSARWKWRLKDLRRRVINRDRRLAGGGRPSRFLAG